MKSSVSGRSWTRPISALFDKMSELRERYTRTQRRSRSTTRLGLEVLEDRTVFNNTAAAYPSAVIDNGIGTLAWNDPIKAAVSDNLYATAEVHVPVGGGTPNL